MPPQNFQPSKLASEPVRPIRPKADAKDLNGYDSLDDAIAPVKKEPVKPKKVASSIDWGDIA